MKIVFLDIDGVLNNWGQAIEDPDWDFLGGLSELSRGIITRDSVGWCQSNVDALRMILDETFAHVVISSLWRKFHSIDEFRKFFRVFGLPDVVVDCTGSVDNGFRGNEVNLWLQNPRFTVERHVILDDERDFHPDQPLIKIDGQFGLTKEHARKAIEILNS